MNKKENSFYQRMIREIRYLNAQSGGWSGKAMNAPAVTRYPNVAAEIIAFSGYLWCPAQHAGVSQEILAAVLESNEELSASEMAGLSRLYRCRFEYLTAPTLQLIDPATSKGKAHLWRLLDMMEHSGGLVTDFMWKIDQVRNAMEDGRPVTYAAWRQACQTIQDAVNAARRPSIRTVRRAAV